RPRSWDARLLMERSRAVKCPDISAHLAGTKKVQEVLPQAVNIIHIYSSDLFLCGCVRLQGAERDKTVSMALAAAERFVLKPQREGGGGWEERWRWKGCASYGTKLLRPGIGCWLFVMLAFSLFSYRQGKDMVINECVGHLLRTKNSGHSDGGVAAGVTVLHNPLLS
uniref:Glutathione synthase n=1 Tax=Oreochromis aureus TaxID=47969 RepID=A0AAZ1XQ92_OREAU